jgi:hypothetical protein
MRCARWATWAMVCGSAELRHTLAYACSLRSLMLQRAQSRRCGVPAADLRMPAAKKRS